MQERRKRRVTPEQTEKMLNSPEALRGMVPQVRQLALAELMARKAMLQKTVCSAAWFSACWSEGEKFPPPANTTPMVPCQCDRCLRKGTVWPPNYCEKAHTTDPQIGPAQAVVSYECFLESLSDWEAAQLPSSPSGMALRAVREGRIKIRRVRTRLGKQRRVG